MTELFLIRHGKSSWADESLRDQERPLNARGQQQLPALARTAQHLGALDGLILSSDARRATQTLAGITAGRCPPDRILTEAGLYTFDYRVLLKQLAIVGDEQTITVVGHNPALLDMASYLLENPPDSFPTGSLMHIHLPARPWNRLKKHSGQLRTLLTPRDICFQQFIRKRDKHTPDNAGPLVGHIPDALLHQYQLLRDLENGVMHGFDEEFLHQYRVAIRRSRAIAESVAGLVEMRNLDKGIKTLKRHGRATSTLRDLHVFITDREEDLRTAGALPFFQSLAHSHHQQLREHLQSGQYHRDMDRWYRLITSPSFRKHTLNLKPKDIQCMVESGISRYNQRAAELNKRSPDEDIHALRKTLKRIRYLMELQESGRNNVMTKVKKRQRWLGTFQDLHVHLELLQRFREDKGTPTENGRTEGAINALIENVEQGKAALRRQILTHHRLML
ncbi:MAG: CHAD domain-containing protein [Marinobacter sp.]|nr:CHAD domain-containing protein [Marinobacter sp.]